MNATRLAIPAVSLLFALNLSAQLRAGWGVHVGAELQAHRVNGGNDTGFAVAYDRMNNETCVASFDVAGSPLRTLCADYPARNSVRASDGALFFFGQDKEFSNNEADREMLVVAKVDRHSRTVWSRSFGPTERWSGSFGAATTDSGLVIAASCGPADFSADGARQAICVAKFTSDGSVQWARRLDESDLELSRDVAAAADSYYVLSETSGRARLTALNANGTVKWHRWFPGLVARGLACAGNGDVVVAGSEQHYGEGVHAWLARVATDGTVRWTKRSEQIGGGRLVISAGSDGSFVLLGHGTGHSDLALVRGDGEVLWHRYASTTDISMRFVESGPRGAVIVAAASAGGFDLHSFTATGQPSSCMLPIIGPGNARFTDFEVARASFVVESTTFSLPAADATTRAKIAPAAVNVTACHLMTRSEKTAGGEAIPPTQEAVLRDRARRVKLGEDFNNRMSGLLALRKLVELEALANDFRSRKSTFESGVRELDGLYSAISYPNVAFGTREQHLALLESWHAQMPSSVTAVVASAKALVHYAFDARGASYAGNVSTAGWQDYERLLSRAKQLLDSSTFASIDPNYYEALLQVAGATCTNISRLAFSPAVAKLADERVFRTAGRFLLPRWCGSTDEYRRLAEYAAEATRSVYGDALYAWLAWDMAEVEQERAAQLAYKLGWPRIRQGFYDQIRLNPKNLLAYQRLAWMARFYDDRGTARDMFSRPETVWDPEAETIWESRQRYDEARRWALTADVQPLMRSSAAPQQAQQQVMQQPSPPVTAPNAAAVIPSPGASSKAQPQATGADLRKPEKSGSTWVVDIAKNWPPLVMLNELTMADGKRISTLLSFLVRTSEGVVAVSALTPLASEKPMPPLMTNLPPRVMLMPIAIDTFRMKMKNWTMWAPSHRDRKLSVASVDTQPSSQRYSHGVVVSLAPAKGTLPAEPLLPAPSITTIQGRDRVFVITCLPNGPVCQQLPITATIVGIEGSGGSSRYTVGFDEAVDTTELYGAPVIDQAGYAVGVVSRRTTDINPSFSGLGENAVFVDVEDIRTLLREAGLKP